MISGSIASGDTFVVSNTSDSGTGSLRDAINQANANAGPDSIEFDIPGVGPHTIQPTTGLPEITDTVIIDGYTQSGASPNTNPPGLGGNAMLMIELDGSDAGDANGLFITGACCTVRGLVINRFDFAGIFIEGAGATGSVVRGDFIGTDVTGSADLGNRLSGVVIQDAPDNMVGGAQPDEGNVISANDDIGIFIVLPGASGNVVQGNLVGTDVTGSADLGSAGVGVQIQDAANNTIGGSQAEEGNVISGNDGNGVFVVGAEASGNVVQGNHIGTDVSGSADLGNAWHGVAIEDAPNNIIGGSQPGARNVISGNDFGGIFITSGASGNVVQGNYIGTDATGSAGLGNARIGVAILDAPNNTIGGSQAEEGNVISSNDGNGIFISGAGASRNVVRGNFIGTDVTGSADLGNKFEGVRIQDAPNNTVGGSQAGVGNVIAFNDGNGVVVSVFLEDTSVSNSIRGNAIYGNGSLGMDLGDDGVTINDDSDADTGPNNLQNYTVIGSAHATDGSTLIVGSLESAPIEEYVLDFYASSEADISNHGEGERYLGSAIVLSDSLGDAEFDVTLARETGSGEYISATATDSMGSTSEFSEVVLLSEGGPTAPAPFKTAVELGEGWWFSDWLGSFNTSFFPWLFHPEHSWMYVFEESTSDDIFLYDLSLEGWLFTSSVVYPSMYSFGRNAWIFYFVGTSGPRQFVELDSGEFFSVP